MHLCNHALANLESCLKDIFKKSTPSIYLYLHFLNFHPILVWGKVWTFSNFTSHWINQFFFPFYPQKYGYTHLSAGDLLRDERKRPGSEYGELIENYIKDGKIVPVEITISLLKRVRVKWRLLSVLHFLCETKRKHSYHFLKFSFSSLETFHTNCCMSLFCKKRPTLFS